MLWFAVGLWLVLLAGLLVGLARAWRLWKGTDPDWAKSAAGSPLPKKRARDKVVCLDTARWRKELGFRVSDEVYPPIFRGPK